MRRAPQLVRRASKAVAAHWIPTFADLAALLLCFFAMLVACYEPDLKRFALLRTSLGGGSGSSVPPVEHAARNARPGWSERLATWSHRHRSTLTLLDVPAGTTALWIECGDHSAFAPGSAQLSPALQSALRELSIHFQRPCLHVELGGHLSAEELGSDLDPNTASLADDRALAARAFLQDCGLQSKSWSIADYGVSLTPIHADAATPEGRHAARRLTLRIDLEAR